MYDLIKSLFGRYITTYKLERRNYQGNSFYMDAKIVKSEWGAFPLAHLVFNVTRHDNSNWTDVVVYMERRKGEKKNDLTGFDYEW